MNRSVYPSIVERQVLKSRSWGFGNSKHCASKPPHFVLIQSIPFSHPSHDPTYHNSTPNTSNFFPSSLNGSFPNVGHVSLTPLYKFASNHNP